MLGEQIGEFRGRRISQRQLPADDLGPREEVTFEETGKLLAFDVRNTLSVVSARRPSGTFYGEGRLTIMTREGDMASGQALGMAWPTAKDGTGDLRYAIHFDIASRRLNWLKDMVVYWETRQDHEGNTEGKLWRWGPRLRGVDPPPGQWPVLAVMPGSTTIN